MVLSFNFSNLLPKSCKQTVLKAGGAILLLYLYALNLPAQIITGCSTGFEFEVVKIVPDPANPLTPAFSTTANPSMLHFYYKVRLKATNGQPLPATLAYTYLSFNGKLNVNTHSSKIDVGLSKQFSNSLNPLFPQLVAALNLKEDGEVDWSFGISSDNCTGSETPTSVSLPPGAVIDLFVIVVQAAPGETICWAEGPAAEVQDCQAIPPCSGVISVSYTGSLCHTVEYPQNCNPSVFLSFESVQGTTLPATRIKVYLDNLEINKPITHIDGHLRLEPSMIGGEIVEFLNDDTNTAGILELDPEVNADGSLDLYYYFNDSGNPFTPDETKELIIEIIVSRYNYSLGGEILVLPQYTRITRSTGHQDPPYVLCNVLSFPVTVDIPGYDQCSEDLVVKAQQIVDYNDDCDWSMRLAINHSKGGPLDLNGLKLEYWFVTSPGNAPLSPVTDLPCPGCITVDQQLINNNNNLWVQLIYENTQSLQLADGSYIELTFSNKEKCVDWFIIGAEATWPDDNKCGLYPVHEAGFPACRPVLKGFVFLPQAPLGDNRSPHNLVTLFNTNTQTDLAETDDDCLDFFNFCRAPSEGPFSVRVETTQPGGHCACGVSTYDMVLINKDILGLETLPWYGKISGNVNLIPSLMTGLQQLSTSDIVEIRKCILGQQTNFGTNSAPSWWYIVNGHQSVNSPNPLQYHPYTGANTSQIAPGASPQFWAIKTGDVNSSCVCPKNNANDADSRAQDAVQYRVDFGLAKRKGREVLLPVYYEGPFPAIALQGGFQFDAALGSLLEVIPNADAGIGGDCFGLTEVASGALRFAWYAERPEYLIHSGTLLFTLRLELEEAAQMPTVWGSERLLAPLAYDASGAEYPVQTRSFSGAQAAQPELGLAVSPNPVSGITQLYIYAPVTGSAQLKILNAAGQPVQRQTLDLQSGEQAIDWNTETMAPGLYFLQVSQQGQSAFAKVIKP